MKAMTAFEFLGVYEKSVIKIFFLLLLMFGSAFLNATTINVTSYVAGDGITDDSVGLQQAFDAAATQNATLQIPANCTIRTTRNLFIHGTCNIQGAGDSSVILCDADLGNGDIHDIHRQRWISVGITRCKADGGCKNTFSGTISNLCFKITEQARFTWGIYLLNASDLTIHDVIFDFRNGVTSDTDPSKVNFLFGALESGNNFYWDPVGPKTLENITVTRCTIVANHRYDDMEGFALASAANVTFTNNFIYGVGDDPIACHGVTGVTIKNNICYSIDGRILATNCTGTSQVPIEISNNYCERIPEFGTTWHGGGAMIMASLENPTTYYAPQYLLIKNNFAVIPGQAVGYIYGIRICGGRDVTIDSNTVRMDSPNGGGCVRVEADTTYPNWIDPTGLDPQGVAKPRNITIKNNLLNGLHPGGIQQASSSPTFSPGPFYVSCNTAGSYIWFSNISTSVSNDNIDYDYATTGCRFDSMSNPAVIYSNTLSNICPYGTVNGTTYTAVLTGRVAGYSISVDNATITRGYICLELWKNGNKIDIATTGITGNGDKLLTYNDPRFAFQPGSPGDTFMLKAVGSSDLLPNTGINVTVNVKGLKSTLAADYSFDNDTTSVVYDSSGNGNNGSRTGTGASIAAGIAGGNAWAFNGYASSYLTVPDSNSLDISDALSVSFWIYSNAVPGGYAAFPIRKGTSSGDTNFVCYYFGSGNEGITFYAKAGGTWKPISPWYLLPRNQWVHVALTYNSASGGQLYINGVATGTRLGSGTLNINPVPLTMGTGLNGMLDEVKILNRELTADEIKNLYNKVNQGQLVGRWGFNDPDSGTMASDSSGNGLDGSIGIGPVWNSTGVWDPPQTINRHALTFNGSGEVTVPDSNKLDVYDKLSISLWINASDYSDGDAGYPIEKRTDTTDANFACCYFGTTAGANQGKIGFLATAGGSWKAISHYATISQNQWVHVALAYNSINGGQLYINGVATGARTGSGTLAVNAADLIIGTGIKGKLDEVRIYNRELSADEIRGLYYMNK